VVAVTAGCCSGNPALDAPRALLYGSPDTTTPPTWHVRVLYDDPASGHGTGVAVRQTFPDSYYGLFIGGSHISMSVVVSPGGPPLAPAATAAASATPEPSSVIASSPDTAVRNVSPNPISSPLLWVVNAATIAPFFAGTGTGTPGYRSGDASGDLENEALNARLPGVRLMAIRLVRRRPRRSR
jgi:hypothetical protein